MIDIQKFEELLDDVILSARNVESAWEWGEGIKKAEKELKQAKQALIEFVKEENER